MIRHIKRLGWIMVVLTILFQLISCGASVGSTDVDSENTSHIFTMGTVFTVRAYADDAREIIREIEQVLYSCDSQISWREKGSLADVFNREHQADMSAISGVIEDALNVSRDSEGAFDLTVLPLSEVWNFDRMGDSEFDTAKMHVPEKEAILEAQSHVDYQKLVYDGISGMLTTKSDDLQIELGAIGKGYAVEQAKALLNASDASGGMISAGSSIYVYGKKEDGSCFRVSLRDPRGDESSSIGILNVTDITISTSGDYERFFIENGKRYHHILDPRTGYPADSGLMQVTILNENSVIGDALSTACFVLGLDKGMALAEKYGVMALFVDQDKNVWYNDERIPEMLEFQGDAAGYVLKAYPSDHGNVHQE